VHVAKRVPLELETPIWSTMPAGRVCPGPGTKDVARIKSTKNGGEGDVPWICHRDDELTFTSLLLVPRAMRARKWLDPEGRLDRTYMTHIGQ
jgi:hypothetical protein